MSPSLFARQSVYFFAFVALFINGSYAPAAPCCRSNAHVPNLITGPHSTQVSSSISVGAVVEMSTVQGSRLKRAENDVHDVATARLEVAQALSESMQFGAGIPFLYQYRKHDHTEASAGGLGDVGLHVGYRLPYEWSDALGLTRALAVVRGSFPTGRSRFEAHELYRVDATGSGFFTLGAGMLFMKNWENFDASLYAEVRRKLPRTFDRIQYKPGWGGCVLLSTGYVFFKGQFRLGAAIQPSWDQGIDGGDGPVPVSSAAEEVWNTILQLSYRPTPEWGLHLSYTDQTWVGFSKNSQLTRNVGLVVQKSW